MRTSRTKWWTSVLVALVLVAAACGGSGGTSGADGGGEPDPDGVLRIGTALEFPGGIHLDPTQSYVNADLPWMQLVMGTLLRNTADGGVEPMMAESYEIVDPQTVRLTLREGVTFTDGSAYDAEAVRAGLLRTRDEASPPTMASQQAAFRALRDVVVDGPRELTLRLDAPLAGELVNALADREGVIVSPEQAASAPEDIDTRAIGAGPYVVEEFREDFVSLRRNPDFFDADSWQLGGVEFVATPTGPTMQNALLSGEVDMVIRVTDQQMNELERDDRFTVTSAVTDRGYIAIVPCTGKPPFDDEAVRRALQIGIDREGLVDLAFDGSAEPAHGFWPADHPHYNPAVEDIVTYDPDEARRLLEDAGATDVTFDLVYPSATAAYGRVGEVIQSQLGEIGLNAEIAPIRDLVSEFIEPQRAGAMMIPGSRTGIDKYSRFFQEGSVQALCGRSRPEVMEAVAPAGGLAPDDPAVSEAFQEAELMIAENAWVVPLVYVPQFAVWSNDRVGGDPQFARATNDLLFDTLYVTG
ncbi:MAG TPA: ABC transporter substrate-binding protein [Acidimicrobiales bacterium]